MGLKFPEGFLWGAATSSHQVEGGNHNDWTEWEKANSGRLAASAAKRNANARLRIPDYILNGYPSPLDPQNYISGRACDHYNRFCEDFDIVKSLGHNAHRFSIEWSRIEPEEGKFDIKEIGHYREVIKSLRQRGLEPFVTLWLWTLPIWLRDIGGVKNNKFPHYFSRYAAKIAEALGSEVKFWITVNEVNVCSGKGYLMGAWPPGRRSVIGYLKVNRHLSRAHSAVYQDIKKTNPTAQIGVAQNVICFTKFFAGLKRYVYNRRFLNSIKKCQDFIGINYYISDRKTEEDTDMDWPIDANGFFSVLKEASRYQKPIYVTENGVADAKDVKRADFIRKHLTQVHRALGQGIDVRGYFYWSLLDNFEWDKGFWPRFGLVEVDYKTMERRIRPSAFEYAKICKENKLIL